MAVNLRRCAQERLGLDGGRNSARTRGRTYGGTHGHAGPHPERGPPAAPRVPGGGCAQCRQAESLAARFKALADPNRLRILSIVSSSDNAESCVLTFPDRWARASRPGSHHLKILVDAGTWTASSGLWAYYSLVPGALRELAATLTRKANPRPTASPLSSSVRQTTEASRRWPPA